jgi:hypothetical protein
MKPGGPEYRAAQLRKESALGRLIQSDIPSKYKVTPCKTRTNSYLKHTPHGTIRVLYTTSI